MNLDGTMGYHSAILTRADRDDITGVEDLEGKTLGFPSQSSNSGNVSPRYFMSKDYGIEDIDAFAGETGFSGSHNNTVIGSPTAPTTRVSSGTTTTTTTRRPAS